MVKNSIEGVAARATMFDDVQIKLDSPHFFDRAFFVFVFCTYTATYIISSNKIPVVHVCWELQLVIACLKRFSRPARIYEELRLADCGRFSIFPV
jgi:hypothetical protein